MSPISAIKWFLIGAPSRFKRHSSNTSFYAFFTCLFLVLLALVGCTVGPATRTPAPATVTPDMVTPPADTPDAARPEPGEESILILEPGPGSRVTTPIHVAGVADPTFEQSLVVRLVLDDGSELVQLHTQITADLGERGPFEVDVPFDVAGERQAFVQVYATSARDGGITHLASVGVTIADAGSESIVPATPHPERIAIFQPETGETISGGTVHVEGFALASFEQTLVVEVLDVEGNVIVSQPVMVAAPDLGQPGPFSADLAYSVAETGPGRIVVRDPSPAFGGDIHLASVEVTLEVD